MNNIWFLMFHLRNKSHLKSSQASSIAFKANYLSNNFIGQILSAESESKAIATDIKRKKAVNNSNLLEGGIKGLNLNDAQVAAVPSVKEKISLAKITGRDVANLNLSPEHIEKIKKLGGLEKLTSEIILKNF